MLPSTHSRRRSGRSNESGWLLLPKSYIYIGVLLSFLFGCLLGNGWKQMQIDRTMTTTLVGNTKPMVLVTGGLGFIGSHVVDDLLENGFGVVVFDDMSNGRNFNKQSNAILLRDITVVEDFTMIRDKIDYIIHLAAAISVPESVRLPEKYERINVEGSRKVLEWAKLNNVKRVVAASSAACYGVPTPENLPLREDTANGGIAPYSQTKFKMEKLMEQYSSAYSLPTTALRFFNVYGPRQDPHSDYSGVISWFMGAAQEQKPIKIAGDGKQYRDFVFVKDVARAVRTAMLLPTTNFDVFNVCTGVKTTVEVLAQEIKNVFTTTSEIVYGDPRPGDVRESVCNPEKAKNGLNFQAEFTLAQGLKQTHAWFIE